WVACWRNGEDGTGTRGTDCSSETPRRRLASVFRFGQRGLSPDKKKKSYELCCDIDAVQIRRTPTTSARCSTQLFRDDTERVGMGPWATPTVAMAIGTILQAEST
ncbi:hypothetical protein CSUI_005296, partial [Cystoisospora suis]